MMEREQRARGARADQQELENQVRAGLTASPKRLPCHLLYDERGSQLFEAITEVPEYYLTRTELAILLDNAAAIATGVGTPRTIVELGAGTGAKTRTILDAVAAARPAVDHPPAVYYPIDVSATALDVAARTLARPGLEVCPLVGRYEDWLPNLSSLPGPRLLLFIGSSIGNYEPADAVQLLGLARSSLSAGDALLVGADLRKPEEVLLPAYDDPAGVTASFTKNLLVRLNRELGATFDLDGFAHVAVWNPERSRMEIYLESRRDQRVSIAGLGLTVHFVRGERVHTENSYKLTLPAQLRLLRDSGYDPREVWLDARSYYAVHLALAGNT